MAAKERTEQEVEEVLNWCWASIERGYSGVRGLMYEEGVKAGIEWALGRTDERPDSD